MPNAFKDVISRLEKQKAAIDRALSALREVDEVDDIERGVSNRAVIGKTGGSKRAQSKQPARKRTMSAEARQRISDALKKRWAASKAKKGIKKTGTKKASGE